MPVPVGCRAQERNEAEGILGHIRSGDSLTTALVVTCIRVGQSPGARPGPALSATNAGDS